MAELNPKKPRIRKSAPTVRERVEAAQAQAEKPPKVRKIRPKVRIKLPDNKFIRVLRKVLGWLVPRYFVNSWREVRQVTWPARKETWRLTLAVFIFALVFGSMVYGVDKLLDEIFKKFILK